MYLIRSNTQRLNQTVNRFPRSLVRSYLFLSLALLLLRVGAAELPKSATLDDVLALATRPERPAKETGNDDERCNALRRLQDWPPAAPEDEARIAAAFTSSLRATNSNIRNAGAWGLGRRGHSEAIPTIFELAEKDCNLIRRRRSTLTYAKTRNPETNSMNDPFTPNHRHTRSHHS